MSQYLEELQHFIEMLSRFELGVKIYKFSESARLFMLIYPEQKIQKDNNPKMSWNYEDIERIPKKSVPT